MGIRHNHLVYYSIMSLGDINTTGGPRKVAPCLRTANWGLGEINLLIQRVVSFRGGPSTAPPINPPSSAQIQGQLRFPLLGLDSCFSVGGRFPIDLVPTNANYQGLPDQLTPNKPLNNELPPPQKEPAEPVRSAQEKLPPCRFDVIHLQSPPFGET